MQSINNFIKLFLQEEFYGRDIILADRDMVETNSGESFFANSENEICLKSVSLNVTVFLFLIR